MHERMRPGMSVWFVVAAVIALVVAVLPLVGPTGAGPLGIPSAAAQEEGAQGEETQEGATTTTPGDASSGSADAELAIIMDASSSMLQPDEGGTRLDVAKRAATELVDSLPETAKVGMLAYGTQVSDAPENHAAGCEDIRALAPVGQVDKDRLRGEIDGLQAQGYTPIGNALRAAAEELSPEASERSIVLVSDGIDTCAPPPPCEVAEELAGQGVGLAVHVVGFRADEATRAELECIAGATGGTYRQADDAAALSESLQFLAQRAIVSYETTGTEFEFADRPEDAMYVGGGLYRTTLETSSGTNLGEAPQHYIRIAVPEGHRAWVALTPLPTIDLGAKGGGQGISSRLTAENESHHMCRSETDISQNFGGAFHPPQASVISIGHDDPDAECDGTQWVVSAQVNSEWRGHAEEAELEMSVQFEPIPGTESGTWPEGDAGKKYDAPHVDTAAAQPVVGGNSFSNATEVGEGAFSDAIVPGEFRFYRFPVEWGQRPVVTLRTGPSARDSADTMYVSVYGPMRHEIANGSGAFYKDGAERTFALDRPVNFHNRERNAGGAERAMAGEHYIAVSMNVTSDGLNGVEQPFELGVRLEGEPGSGPDWAPVNEPEPTPSSSPIEFDGAAPDAEATGGASDSNDDNDNPSAAAAPEDSGLPGWALPAGIGVVLLILAGLGLWFFSRGKSSR